MKSRKEKNIETKTIWNLLYKIHSKRDFFLFLVSNNKDEFYVHEIHYYHAMNVFFFFSLSPRRVYFYVVLWRCHQIASRNAFSCVYTYNNDSSYTLYCMVFGHPVCFFQTFFYIRFVFLFCLSLSLRLIYNPWKSKIHFIWRQWTPAGSNRILLLLFVVSFYNFYFDLSSSSSVVLLCLATYLQRFSFACMSLFNWSERNRKKKNFQTHLVV